MKNVPLFESRSTPRALMDFEKWQPQRRPFVLPPAISAQPRYWFCLKLRLILRESIYLAAQSGLISH